MADKKTLLMAQFYAACRKKGYTDMTDPTQSLKAKVIATDLNLKYGNIVDFYKKSEQCFAIVRKENEEKEILRLKQQEREAQESVRKAIDGILLVTIKNVAGDASLNVFIRPDKSIYSTFNGGEKIEGVPAITVQKGGAVMSTYHPSKAVYTSATVGGITTGGVHYTEDYYTQKVTHSDKGYINVRTGDVNFTVEVIVPSTYTQQRFHRDADYARLVTDGTIRCYQDSTMAKHFAQLALTGAKDHMDRMDLLSRAADERRLPMTQCTEISNLLVRIVKGKFPPTDEEAYAAAMDLSRSKTAADLRKAADLFHSISDYRDSKQRAVWVETVYEEVLQTEKENAVLEREHRSKRRKILTLVFSIVAIFCIIAALCISKMIGQHRMQQEEAARLAEYQSAVALMEAGKLEDAYQAFVTLDDYKDSKTKAETINNTRNEAYDHAIALMEAGKLIESYNAFISLDGYKDSRKQANSINDTCNDIYVNAIVLMETGNLTEAYDSFVLLSGYKDSDEQANTINNMLAEKYDSAVALMNAGNLREASKIFRSIASYKDSAANAKKAYRQHMASTLKTAEVGSYVTFGTFEQDNNLSNGNEDIEWLVLEKEGNGVLLISKYGLYPKSYNSQRTKVTWENSTLRQWLNNDFLSTSFSEDEKELIPRTTVVAQAYEGNDTMDSVFILNVTEAEHYLGDRGDGLICQATEYAVSNGVRVSNSDRICMWWLRTPGRESKDLAVYVTDTGGFMRIGGMVHIAEFAVRPALWISIP